MCLSHNPQTTDPVPYGSHTLGYIKYSTHLHPIEYLLHLWKNDLTATSLSPLLQHCKSRMEKSVSSYGPSGFSCSMQIPPDKPEMLMCSSGRSIKSLWRWSGRVGANFELRTEIFLTVSPNTSPSTKLPRSIHDSRPGRPTRETDVTVVERSAKKSPRRAKECSVATPFCSQGPPRWTSSNLVSVRQVLMNSCTTAGRHNTHSNNSK